MLSVHKLSMEGELYDCDKKLLEYKILYPQFQSTECARWLMAVNRFYTTRANAQKNYYCTGLLSQALDQCKEFGDEIPFHPFEAVSTSEVTLNKNYIISVFNDCYRFTGGAHGSTTRRSETWNGRRGTRIRLCDFFSKGTNYKNYIISVITQQIKDEINSGENKYFEDWETLICEYFDSCSFFVTEEGICLYYQQYQIGPYAIGIPVFVIPWEKGKLCPIG